MNCHVKDDDSSFFVYNISAALAQEVEHRRGKEEVPSSNLGSGLYYVCLMLQTFIYQHFAKVNKY